jgi:hypothetical protein
MLLRFVVAALPVSVLVNDRVVGLLGPNLQGAGAGSPVAADEVVLVSRRTSALRQGDLIVVRSPHVVKGRVVGRAVGTAGDIFVNEEGRIQVVQPGELFLLPAVPLLHKRATETVTIDATGQPQLQAEVEAQPEGETEAGEEEDSHPGGDAKLEPDIRKDEPSSPFAVPLVMLEGRAIAVVWPPQRMRILQSSLPQQQHLR